MFPSQDEVLCECGRPENECAVWAGSTQHMDIDDYDEDEVTYSNHYVHHGKVWVDEWDCMCNNECPVCGAEIEPFMSVDHSDENNYIMHVGADFVPEDGWPEGVSNLEELKEMALEGGN